MYWPRARTAAQLHQRIRLFRAGREDTARPVIFEGPPDQSDTRGKQSGGKRVASKPRVAAVIEMK